LPPQYRDKVRKALLPYGDKVLSYAGFVVIDSSTFNQAESKILATRKNKKTFDVELLCVETLKVVGHSTYSILEAQLKTF